MTEKTIKTENPLDLLKNRFFNNKKVKDSIAKTTKQIINFFLIVLLIITSFFIGYFYSDISLIILNKKQNFGEVKNRNNTSVSITERGELMIIDRIDQKIQIYDDTIANIIFNSYSNRLIDNSKKTK